MRRLCFWTVRGNCRQSLWLVSAQAHSWVEFFSEVTNSCKLLFFFWIS